ncbi:hypothetical protein GWI33_000195 [Rhynchophorus ferrugineus]|uniref:Uncharacterized protein n=1 Tax=Rhynchophorus ferrugineus TaxID=354439 RepID=A0A834IYI8_RHYFE|nr:hypothetical protein GWI33_000195 [Rhynchophorus ferrugineus]
MNNGAQENCIAQYKEGVDFYQSINPKSKRYVDARAMISPLSHVVRMVIWPLKNCCNFCIELANEKEKFAH